MAQLPSDLTVRSANPADFADLARLQLSSALAAFAHIFPASIPQPTQTVLETEWRDALNDPGLAVLVAEVDGNIAGLVAFGRQESATAGTDCVLRKLYIAPEASGRGIGGLLHDRAVAALRAAGCTRVHLWVLERNIVARRMYTRRGWKLQRRTRSDWPGSGILELGYALDLNTRL